MSNNKKPQTSFAADSSKKTFDPSDALANASNNLQTLTFEHCFTDTGARFKAYLVDFQEQYETNWNQEDVYGRNDPIQIFQNTKRKISVTWNIPAFGEEEAANNLAKASKLIHMLYPAYETAGGGQTNIAAGPVFKVRFANLICSAEGDNLGPLYCTLNGLSFRPDLEAGFFEVKHPNAPELSLFPKNIELSTQMSVLHTHPLGWQSQGEGDAFPRDLWMGPRAKGYAPNVAYEQSTFPFGLRKFNSQKLHLKSDGEEKSKNKDNKDKKPPTDPKSKKEKKATNAALNKP